MEILRDLGIEEEAISRATPQEYMGEQVYAESLVGQEYGRIRTWQTHPAHKAEHDMASPSSVCDLPQLYFEPMVVQAALLRGSDIRFSTAYLGHVQDNEGRHDHAAGCSERSRGPRPFQIPDWRGRGTLQSCH
jgi:2,4-dichlorophenol 6-monooxygenase